MSGIFKGHVLGSRSLDGKIVGCTNPVQAMAGDDGTWPWWGLLAGVIVVTVAFNVLTEAKR